MSEIRAVNAVQYRVVGSTRPNVGVVVEITVGTPSGEQRLPAFWMPADAAKGLAQALEKQAAAARNLS